MSEKTLFLVIHFIGVGLIGAGYFVLYPFLLFLGLSLIVTNAIMMVILCNIEFK